MAPAVAAMLLLLQNCSGEPLHVARVRLLLGNDPVADAAADQTPLAAVDLDQRTHHAMLRSRTLARRTLIRLNDDWSLPLNALTTPRTGVPVSGSHTGIACPGSLLSGRPLDNEAVADHSGPPPVQVDTLLTHLTVAPVPGTLLVDLTFRGTDPERATRVVNVLAAEYVASRRALDRQHTETTLAALRHEISSQSSVVEHCEAALQSVRAQHPLTVEARRALTARRLVELTDALTAATSARSAAEAENDRVGLMNVAGERAPFEALTAPSAVVQTLIEWLATANEELDRLSQRYGPRHPALLAARAARQSIIQEIRTHVRDAVSSSQAELDTARQEERRLRGVLDAARQEAVALASARASERSRERECRTAWTIYDALLEREQDLHGLRERQGLDVSVVDWASPDAVRQPAHAAWPPTLVLGFVVTICWEFGVRRQPRGTDTSLARKAKA